MKVVDLIERAKEEIVVDKEEAVVELIKASLLEIESCENTLAELVAQLEELLDSDIEDLELDDFEY